MNSDIRSKFQWVCIILITLFPLTTFAAATLAQATSGAVSVDIYAPFSLPWIGVWLFALVGAFGAGLININEIDERFHNPMLAKIVIGTPWGVSISFALKSMTEIPMGLITLSALGFAYLAAPLCAGILVWFSNQKRIDGILDNVNDTVSIRTFGKKSREKNNETDSI